MVIYDSVIIPLFLALILSILHFFSSKVSGKIEKYHSKIISLSAGILVSLLFLEILPLLLKTRTLSNSLIFTAILGGFVVFHIAEKYLYQHIKHKKELLKDLAELHVLGFYINHFILGFLLVLAGKGTQLLIFIPLLLHTVSSSISLEHIHEKIRSNISKRIFIASSTFLGALVAILLSPAETLYILLFSIITGMVLYISFRDMVPKEKEGSPQFFLLGVLLIVILLILI